MAMSDAERARNYRRRKGAQPGGRNGPLPTQPCGTHAGYTRHRRNNQPICAACLDAERAYQRDAASRRRTRLKNNPTT